MQFAPDTFESVARRKKLAGWLMGLKGPAKPPPEIAIGGAGLIITYLAYPVDTHSN